ncbi:DUF3800 domain-containing protein [Pseudomonas syringae]|uniref:DUF3800 domain-containing protein n=1 Tax=Pseudomonas syringae TaxID=317 RepID=UPI001F3B488F|nr:DUF3800 domain-containing protein [Pseudomonas syringae]MCF5209304.1 DUF3800 domain-containing protein [Pseudomonas syringae]
MNIKDLYLDESGNSGDLISRKNGLGFAGQPVFSLAAVDISQIEDLESRINGVKNKLGIKAAELKSADVYKKKPQAMLDVFSILIESKSPFFVEVVDKKYFISTSIAAHQFLPPYYTGDESHGKFQIPRNVAANVMALDMPDEYFDLFFESCHEPNEKNLLNSMNGIKGFFEAHPIYGEFSRHVEMSIQDYFDFKQSATRNKVKNFARNNGVNPVLLNKLVKLVGEQFDLNDEQKLKVVRKFVPIPDNGKRGNNILLLPHVSSLANIIARANLANQGSIEEVTFHHDKQDHFDEALIAIKELMFTNKPEKFSPPTPNSNFNITSSANLKFLDSKKTIGIQIADLLAGFFSRFYDDFFNNKIESNSIYHDIYNLISEGADRNRSVGVNWVVPPSRLYELEHQYNEGVRRKPSEDELLQYVAKEFGVNILLELFAKQHFARFGFKANYS